MAEEHRTDYHAGLVAALKTKYDDQYDFMETVRKYTRARKLTPQMLNELIDKIEVYQSEKIDGKNVQRLKIHYACIGAIDIPDFDAIPDNEVKVHTRQGVDILFNSRECVAV